MRNLPMTGIALITGAGTGIGKYSALALSAAGFKLVLTGRRLSPLEAVAAECETEAVAIPADVSAREEVDMLFSRTQETFGRLDVLFNNAGHGGGGDFPNSTDEEWNSVINDNLNGTFYVSRAVWPHLIASGGGAIVNMSSLAAQRGFSPKMIDEFGATAPAYYAAKAGIDALTRYMAGVGGKHNIRVNCVRPGQILTPGATRGTIDDADGGHHVFESMFDFAQIIPGPGYPIDVANVVLFLVSDESRFVTSEMINIDGGVAAKI